MQRSMIRLPDSGSTGPRNLNMATGSAAFFQIFLVILFRWPESFCGNDLRDDGFGKFVLSREASDGCSRGLLLLR